MLPKKVQSFMEKLDNLYIMRGLDKEDRYRLIFKNCNVIDYAKDKEELKLKEIIYITRLDEVSKFIDGLIVKEPIISLNSKESLVRIKKHEGIIITAIETSKVS